MIPQLIAQVQQQEHQFKIKGTMKRQSLFWVLGCIIGSIIYAIVFRYRVVSIPDFIVSTKDLLIYMVLFFFMSTILTIPILILFLFSEKKKMNSIKTNILFLIGSLVYLSILQLFIFKDFQDSIDLFLTYGITFLVIINVLMLDKKLRQY